MAIDYTEVFTAMGKVVQACNYYASTFATMKTNGEEAVQELVDLDRDYLTDGISNAVSSHISGLSAGCSFWGAKAAEILLDPELVTNHLPITNPQLSNVLPALAVDMIANAQSFLVSPTAVGAPSFAGVGNGSLLTTLALDDITAPVSPVSASQMNYSSAVGGVLLSNLGAVGTVYCRCTNGDTEGSEQFLLYGNRLIPPYQENDESPGGSVTLGSADSLNILTNEGFETYSAGFTDWTITDAGGTLVQETTLMYRGASAARINTLANADTVIFEQTLATSLTRGKSYICGIRVKSVAAESGGALAGTIELFSGATNLSGGAISAVAITSTAWGTAYGVLVVPQTIDPDEELTIKISLSPTVDNVDGLIFDDAFLVPITYFNGVGYVLQNGATRFRLGDLFTTAITRSAPGVFQEFFRKNFGVQMPAETSTNETIPDSLAT